MKALNMKPTTFDKNIACLANRAGITLEEFLNMDAIAYGDMVWGATTVWYTNKTKAVLGNNIYEGILTMRSVREYCRDLVKKQQVTREYPPLPPSPPATPTLRSQSPISVNE